MRSERHTADGVDIIPVILKSGIYEGAKFARFNYLPDGGKPVGDWGKRDRAWTNVSKGIECVVESRRALRRGHRPPELQ